MTLVRLPVAPITHPTIWQRLLLDCQRSWGVAQFAARQISRT
jgi:hypothetical protein